MFLSIKKEGIIMCYNNQQKETETASFYYCKHFCTAGKRCGWDCWFISQVYSEGENSKEE